MGLHGDYQEVKSLSVDQACNGFDRVGKEIKEIREKAAKFLKQISGAEKYKKELKSFLLKNLRKIDRAKWEAEVKHCDIPAFSYSTLKLLKKKLTNTPY